MKKILFKKEWYKFPDWGTENDEIIKYYIEFTLYLDFKQGLRFSASIPNYLFCSRNPFKCLFEVLEYSITGCGQYVRLEDRLTKLNLWKEL